jgi:hypothetical protein
MRTAEGHQKSIFNTPKVKKNKDTYIWGSFSEESDKIGRGFIKILETWQFGLSFNIIRYVFFCFGQKKNFVGFMNF